MELLVYGKVPEPRVSLLTKTLLIMKLTACLILIATLQVSAKTYAQKISVKGKNISLEKVFDLIKDQTGYAFVYDPALIKQARPVSIDVKDMPLQQALDYCFKEQPFTYEIKYKVIVLKDRPRLPAEPLVLQSATPPPPHQVSGTVTDEKGTPVEGASVILKPGNRGAATDARGLFVISNVEDGTYTLLVSYVGYTAYEKKIIVSGQNYTLDASLQAEANALNETVVVGYGTVRKSDLTGAVSSVSSDKVTQVKAVSNVAQALQGMAAGVQVNQSSGQPGESMIIKIRGTNSINGGNAPLYVVDGLPLDGLSAQLNPDDIERIEVLKDASSTAIYGSRGANGVIMITTKKGKQGKTQVAYNGYVGVQSLRKKKELVNAQEFAQLQNEAVTNDNASGVNQTPQPLPWTDAQLDSLAGKGTDWQDLVYRHATVQNHDISISGGSASTKYYTSFGYYDQDGIITNSNFKRLSFRANVSNTISDKLSINTSLSLQNSIYRQAVYAGADGGGGIPFTTMVIPPTQGVYDAAGNYTKFTGVSWGETNPVGISNALYNPTSNIRIIGNTGLTYEIIPGLKVRLNAGVDAGFNKSDYYAPSIISIGQPGGKASKNYSNSTTFVTEDLLTYAKNFGKHNIDALGGATYQYSKAENLNSGTGVTFITDAFQNNNIGAATTAAIPGTGFSDSKLISYLGRFNYNYDGKYFATVTGRYDGSSRFAENNKYAFFPSGAVAWRMSEEAFMKDIAVVSNLKLRASYGLSGNQAIGNYQTLARLSNVNTIFDNAINIAYVQGSLAYSNLKWETTKQLDLGLDLGLFKDRVQLTFDYYNKKTVDLLLNVGLATSSGFSSVLQNFGAVQNRGYEIQLATVNTTGVVKWTSVLNFSHNATKVLQLENDATGKPVLYKELGAGGNWFPTIVGQSMGQLYGYKVTGIYQSDEEAVKNGEPTKRAGDYKFWDMNGDGVVDGNDRSTLTHLEPKFTFGFNNSISYKNFQLSLLFVGSYGNDIVNEFRKYNITMNGSWAPSKEAFDERWQGAGSSNSVDKPSKNSGSSIRDYANSLWVENGSYIKLRDITLGYNFSPGVLKALRVSAINLYVSAQNFITITKYSGYDPEVSWSAATVNGWDRGNYPSMKSLTAGLKVNF